MVQIIHEHGILNPMVDYAEGYQEKGSYIIFHKHKALHSYYPEHGRTDTLRQAMKSIRGI